MNVAYSSWFSYVRLRLPSIIPCHALNRVMRQVPVTIDLNSAPGKNNLNFHQNSITVVVHY